MTSHLVLIANAKDGTISSFDLSHGVLTPLAVSDVGAPGMPLAVDPARDLVFAGTSNPVGVTVLGLDRASGTLTVAGRHSALGAPTYLTLSSDARLLFSASYHQGIGEVWQLGSDGDLTGVGGPVHHGNLHSVQVSDDGFAYFVSLRDDLVAQYAVTGDGSLTPLDPPTVAAPEGSGPRHLVLDAAQASLYVITEFSGQALHYRRDAVRGTLELASRATCVPTDRGLSPSRFGANPRAEELIWCSDLHLDDSGRLLYCAERNRATITAVRVLDDGSLGEPVSHSDVVAQPRSFAILPDGNLLVASEIDRVVALYRADADGRLAEVSRHDVGLGANWIEILAR